jgi:hypothetical protein
MGILEPLSSLYAADGGGPRCGGARKTSPIKSKCVCCEKLTTAAFFSHFFPCHAADGGIAMCNFIYEMPWKGASSRTLWRMRTQTVCRPRTIFGAILRGN